MSISSSIQQFSGGVATWVAGLVVVQLPTGKLDHYPTLGWCVTGSMFLCVILMYQVNRIVDSKKASDRPAVAPEAESLMEAS